MFSGQTIWVENKLIPELDWGFAEVTSEIQIALEPVNCRGAQRQCHQQILSSWTVFLEIQEALRSQNRTLAPQAVSCLFEAQMHIEECLKSVFWTTRFHSFREGPHETDGGHCWVQSMSYCVVGCTGRCGSVTLGNHEGARQNAGACLA